MTGAAVFVVAWALLLTMARMGKNGSRPAAALAGMLKSDVAITTGGSAGMMAVLAGAALVGVAQNPLADVKMIASASSLELIEADKIYFLMASLRTGWASRGR